MPTLSDQIVFSLVALAMVLTPGPNTIYFISLSGAALGFVFCMLCAAFGITAFVMTLPLAYDALRLAGAYYLLYLARQVLRPGGRAPFQLRNLQTDSPRRLFLLGHFTKLLNPNAALLYLSLLPQFIDPSRGSVLIQRC